MPTWTLSCPHCTRSFEHSKIEVKKMVDYLWPEKPKFPEGGSDIKCPHCGQVAKYQRTDLLYKLDSQDGH
jgi:uncharacterized C2H2 Zn-finger protein